MDQSGALGAFAALAQETRLDIVRVLVRAGPQGLAAGLVATELGVSPSSASFHLAQLERAGLIGSRREARSIIYSAAYPRLAALVDFLMQDCCQGHPEVCRAGDAKPEAACCEPAEARG